MDFPKLAPRSKILVALAGLMLENKEKDFFTGNEITEWIEKRMPDFGDGKKRVVSNKLKEMRENNEVIVSDQTGKELGTVEVLECTTERPYLYKIGSNTVETQMSAKLLKKLHDGRPIGVKTVPAEVESKVVNDIYEEFKDDKTFRLKSQEDIKNKIQDAVNALYFVRNGELLESTRRLSIDDIEFIEFLSKN